VQTSAGKVPVTIVELPFNLNAPPLETSNLT
jgi:hypothetical protein